MIVTKYVVYDNGKPASEVGYPQIAGNGWLTHEFQTLEYAREHIAHWLGSLRHSVPWDTAEVGDYLDYSGYGDFVWIIVEREVVWED